MDNTKQRYEKYKYRVKIWEKDFKRINGRIPSKHDIREAPKEIRDSYKMYYKLKTSFLEDTLNDVLSEDGFDVLDTSQGEGSFLGDAVGNLPEGVAALVNPETSSSNLIFSNVEQLDVSQKVAITNIVNLNEDHVIKHFEPVEELELNKNAWGNDVSKDSKVKTKSPEKPFKSNLGAKLFPSKSFSKRNPRKGLTRSASNMSSSITRTDSFYLDNSQNQEELPDLETILSQKSQKSQEDSIPVVQKIPQETKTDVDKKWLARCQSFDSGVLAKISSPSAESEKPKKYGISNINVEEIYGTISDKVNIKDNSKSIQEVRMTKTYDDSDSVVSNSEDEEASRSVRHIVKKRRILGDVNTNNKSSVVKELKSITHAEEIPVLVNDEAKELLMQNNEEMLPKSRKRQTQKKGATVGKRQNKKTKDNGQTSRRMSGRNKNEISYCELKSDEVEKIQADRGVSEEDEPIISGVKRTRRGRPVSAAKTGTTNKKATKRKHNANDDELEDMTENNNTLEKDEEINYAVDLMSTELKSLPRINVEELAQAEKALNKYMNTAKMVPTKSSIKDYKESLKKEKLEAKVASGKLNENFVRLNMKQKVFAKGRKKFNYGRYKKTMWKQKKVAALSGPDMDMGGCDGGILSCFICGQPGHFARQCKAKGDNLLPLDTEVEDESPFLTLEEAEKMASQQAIQVHCKNIENMPVVSNTLLYKEEGNNEDNENHDQECNGEKKTLISEELYTDEKTSNSSNESTLNSQFNCELTVNQTNQQTYIGHKIPEDFLKKAGLLEDTNKEVEPLYNLQPDGSTLDVTNEVIEVLRMFGHTDFRKGQDKAVMRILSGLSTLVTLSTGSGKSLCYQLPAYLYSRKRKAITLVISPLVSLMEDQVHGVPAFIRAHCLHTNQTPLQRQNVLELVNKGEVDVLLVSPEAVVAGEKSTGFGALLRSLPSIAFACIDEAHCVSQWSHNFRPSYLMICQVLRQKLGVKTILGLTATATLSTRDSIIQHLGIHDGPCGVITDIPLPDNLILSVSKDDNRDVALLQLLRSERFDPCQSIIVYCTRREECERISSLIRTSMQDKKPAEENRPKQKSVNWNAESYHAGLPAYRRRTIQKAFMENRLRIVVATIAFGMGINKADIRAIIHYNMPKNFESYVQEVGRAGRDGKIAHCHLFLDRNNADLSELRRHIYANSIDRHVIRKLLQKIFIPCACEKNFSNKNFVSDHSEEIKALEDINWEVDFDEDISKQTKRKRKCPGHEIGFSIEQTVQMLDIPAENISTLLCYLELDEKCSIKVLSNAYNMAKVMSYGGPKHLKHAAKSCPPLAMAIALALKKGIFDEEKNIIEFSVIEIASAIGWNSGVVKYQLKNLEWTTVDGLPKRSSISVDYYDLGFRVRAPGDFTDDELDEALDSLYHRAVHQEKAQLKQLQYVFQGLSSVAYRNCVPCCDKEFSEERSELLKKQVREYFKSDYLTDIELIEEPDNTSEDQITNDVRSMIYMYPENNFTGRTLARIFHGISSPNYPAVIWGRCKYWRAYSKTDFNRLVRLANLTIVRMRT